MAPLTPVFETVAEGPADTDVARLANRFDKGVGLNLATVPMVRALGLGLLVGFTGGGLLVGLTGGGPAVTQPKNGSGSSPGSSTALTAALPARLGHFELMCPGLPQEWQRRSAIAILGFRQSAVRCAPPQLPHVSSRGGRSPAPSRPLPLRLPLPLKRWLTAAMAAS